MRHAQQSLGVSERRACRVLGQVRSTQQYRPKAPQEETALVERMTELATQYGRYGYRRITALMVREGWRVNHKRIERLWRREGLRVPKRQPKRGRLWLNDGSCVRLRPERKDHVWAYDFVHERTHDGRALRLLTIVDEYTRECLAIEVARRLNSEDVLERLAELFVNRGVPDHIRSDSGPEFTSRAVREWLERIGVKTLFIEPGSPWENGYVESFNGKLRDELLNGEIFYTLQRGSNHHRTMAETLQHHQRTQCFGLPPASPANHRPNRPKAGRALTFKLAQLVEAGQAMARKSEGKILNPV